MEVQDQVNKLDSWSLQRCGMPGSTSLSWQI